MANLNWLTLSDIYSRYLDMAEYDDGTSALEFIEQCQDGLAYEKSMFESFGAKAEDRFAYEMHTKPALTMIRNTKELVLKWMVDGAAKGCWFAFGRRHPDSEEEMIPSRYWPFLKLDIKNGVATGHGTFRALRGLIWQDIPQGHPVHGKIRVGETRPEAAAEPGEIARANIRETSATPLPDPARIHNDVPDFPSRPTKIENPGGCRRGTRLSLAIEICERRVQTGQTAHSKLAEATKVAELFAEQYPYPPLKPIAFQTIRIWLSTPEGNALWKQRQ
jgi:hypothetical protein